LFGTISEAADAAGLSDTVDGIFTSGNLLTFCIPIYSGILGVL
jgi:hypothetical protein